MRGRPHIPFQDEDRLCPVPGLVAATRNRERERERGGGQEGYLELNHIEQRLVEEEALLAAPDVHIYHPLLLPGQTSGHTDRVQRLNPSPRPHLCRAPEELRFAGATPMPSLTPERRDESLT
jgi:hypothetical protein